MKYNYLGDDSKVYTVKMTRKQALQLGLVKCKSCGYPPNNHFDHEPFKCAHNLHCTGYEEIIVL